MKLDLIQCTVRLNQDGNVALSEIIKAGPDAITPIEAMVLMAQHNTDETDEGSCLFNVKKVGEVERTKGEEISRLISKYGGKVKAMLPAGSLLPHTLEDLDLPRDRFAAAPKPKASPDAELRKELRAKLKAADVEIPKGKLSIADLQALVDEVGAEAA